MQLIFHDLMEGTVKSITVGPHHMLTFKFYTVSLPISWLGKFYCSITIHVTALLEYQDI